MIQIIDNFFDEKSCKYLIEYFEKNKDKHFIHTTGVKFIDITNNESDLNFILKKIKDYVFNLNKYQIDFIQIVKWFDDCSHGLHTDYASDKTVFSSINYLNEGYIGGQTFFEEGTIIAPRKGRGLFFDGVNYKHGVMKVKRGPRYTLAGWYKK